MKYKANETSYMHGSGSCGCSNEKSHCYSQPYYVNEDYHYEKPKCEGEKKMGYYGEYHKEDYRDDYRKKDCRDDCHRRDFKDDCHRKDHKDDCCKKDCHEKCDCCCTPGMFKQLKKLEGCEVIIWTADNKNGGWVVTILDVDCDVVKTVNEWHKLQYFSLCEIITFEINKPQN